MRATRTVHSLKHPVQSGETQDQQHVVPRRKPGGTVALSWQGVSQLTGVEAQGTSRTFAAGVHIAACGSTVPVDHTVVGSGICVGQIAVRSSICVDCTVVWSAASAGCTRQRAR